jgi:hypothetical protein
MWSSMSAISSRTEPILCRDINDTARDWFQYVGRERDIHFAQVEKVKLNRVRRETVTTICQQQKSDFLQNRNRGKEENNKQSNPGLQCKAQAWTYRTY